MFHKLSFPKRLFYIGLAIVFLAVVSIFIYHNKPAQADISTGLVGYWNFDETSGITAIDSSGAGNNGNVNGATWTVGKVNNALSFDGVDDYVKSPHAGVNTALGTLVMWVKPNFANTNNNNHYFFDSDSARHAFFHYGGATHGIEMYNDGRVADFNVAWNANEWHHAVFIWDKASDIQKLYWDGVEQTAASRGGTWGSNNIGTNIYTGARYTATDIWNGLLDEVRVYNRALSASEITELYTAGGGTPPPVPFCGDLSCNGTETCSICPQDCGVCPTTYQCSDNIDNDSDGLTDYPNDPGCSSTTDNDEYNASQPLNEVTAASCTAADIDIAINSVKNAGGGTVFLPPCEITYSPAKNFHIPGGVSIIGNGRAKTILHEAIFHMAPYYYGTVGDGKSRLAHLAIKNSMITAAGRAEFRGDLKLLVDHVDFEGRGDTFIEIIFTNTSDDGYVVFSHDTFNNYTSYGIYIHGRNTYYDNQSVFPNNCTNLFGTSKGSGGTVFIEDSNFTGYFDHPVDGTNGAHYVVRYNTFNYNQVYQTGPGPMEGHGPDSPFNTGTNNFEIYNNLITQSDGHSYSSGILLRSGCAVVYNNTIEWKEMGIAMGLETNYDWHATCAGIYPCTAGNQVHGAWIWDNTYNNICHEYNPYWGNHTATCVGSSFGNVRVVWNSDYWIQQDRDYFLRAPSQQQDGFTYTPYPYPHPLTLGETPPDTVPPSAPTGVSIQ